MSLTDLKKSKESKATKEQFSVDDFIADADNYAKGAPQIVSNDGRGKINLKQAIDDAKRLLAQNTPSDKTHKPFRRATFTLSESTIAQLQYLSEDTDLAKSHIIRILIDELSNTEQDEKIKKLLRSTVS